MTIPSLELFPSPDLYPGFADDPVTTFTTGVLESFDPWLNADADDYISALAFMFEQVFSLVVDLGDPDTSDFTPGWSLLLDPNNCPTEYLPYLSQFNGTGVPPGTPDATARATIKAEGGQQRGTAPTIVATAQLYLSGTQSCTLIERTAANGSTADPYYFLLIVRPEEVINEAQLIAAVNNVKPGGVFWSLIESDNYTWAEAIHTWAADTMTWDATANTQP